MRTVNLIIVCVMMTVFFISMYCFSCWYNEPVYAQPNPCKLEDLVDDVNAVNKAVRRMGPYYSYSISPTGVLKVNIGDGKWSVLNYKKGDE